MNKSQEKSFNVANILRKKIMNGKPYYYIEWEGYPLSEATWEPLKNLQCCMDLVHDFEEKNEKKQQLPISLNKPKKISLKNLKRLARQRIQKTRKIIFHEEFYRYGSFKEGDKAKRIVFIKKDLKNKKLMCAVEWQKRENGLQPSSTFYTNEEIKLNDPKILIDYYESKLKFIK